MQRLPIAKVLGFATLGWGVVLITTPACHNFAGIAANRFLLGLLEATVNPYVQSKTLMNVGNKLTLDTIVAAS